MSVCTHAHMWHTFTTKHRAHNVIRCMHNCNDSCSSPLADLEGQHGGGGQGEHHQQQVGLHHGLLQTGPGQVQDDPPGQGHGGPHDPTCLRHSWMHQGSERHFEWEETACEWDGDRGVQLPCAHLHIIPLWKFFWVECVLLLVITWVTFW